MFNWKINFSSSYQNYLSVHARYFAPDTSFLHNFAHGVAKIENIPDQFFSLHPGLRLKPSLDNLISYFSNLENLFRIQSCFNTIALLAFLIYFSTFT